MKKEAVFIALVFLLSFVLIRLPRLPAGATPGTVIVPQDYPTIQQAIDVCSPGGTVLVGPGTYNENITVWKPLTIKGENKDTTIMDQVEAFIVCHITADNVTISGFTIKDGSIGVSIDASDEATITNNIITSNDDGMWATSSLDNVISNNTISDNLFMGVYLKASNNTTLNSNTIVTNTYGIYIENSEHNSVCGNNLSLNYADGIDVINSSYNAVFHNMISNNSRGIYLQGSNSNSIYENNLVNNLDQAGAEDIITNSWDDGTHGNYWSNYTGIDSNSDGIGDTAFTIDSSNKDRYPLMNPWMQPSPGHDVAVINAWSSKTVIGQGYNGDITVFGANKGEYAETFNLTVYIESVAFASWTLHLEGGLTATIRLSWNTTDFSKKNYTISASATAVPGETDSTDNNCTWTVHVGVPGDVSSSTAGVYDGTVNMRDISYIILMFNTKPSSSNWNPNADVNNDLIVNMRDISIAILNFNKHE